MFRIFLNYFELKEKAEQGELTKISEFVKVFFHRLIYRRPDCTCSGLIYGISSLLSVKVKVIAKIIAVNLKVRKLGIKKNRKVNRYKADFLNLV